MDEKQWLEMRTVSPEQLQMANVILDEIIAGVEARSAIRKHPLPGTGYIAKYMLVAAYNERVRSGDLKTDEALLAAIRMKPVRSLSGVSTVTVLTGPHDCPGDCIFCPNEKNMPKSYLNGEPGAMRGLQNNFDPYLQVKSRLEALQAVGHPTQKIELLILGGTWSRYPREYQEWFVRRCFDAMNERESASLEEAQLTNESAAHRNVGLVIETRPDCITSEELNHLRSLGVTKIQIGAQSLDDRILQLNHRGHGTRETLAAVALGRAAGFKIVLHWMPNLLGSDLEMDKEDFSRLWQGGYAPDEIKIYPTQLLENTRLHEIWKEGGYRPYTTGELVHLIADLKTTIPPYCRVNRVIRDIPSTVIAAGNRRSSLRVDILEEMKRRGTRCGCIRCREVKSGAIDPGTLREDVYPYTAAGTDEFFISMVTPEDKIAGYVRLSMPGQAAVGVDLPGLDYSIFPELKNAAIIREVHVFGQSLSLGQEVGGAAQHSGLGARLIELAEKTARARGFHRIAVIAAIGTRLYYGRRGFKREGLYMTKNI